MLAQVLHATNERRKPSSPVTAVMSMLTTISLHSNRTEITAPGVGNLTPSSLRRLALAAALLALTSPAVAQQPQPLDSIRDAARAYATQELTGRDEHATVEIGRLDSRLRLERCDRPLETFQTPGQRNGGRTTIGVRCVGQAPWTIYVSARITRHVEVYTAARSLARGTRLGQEDVRVMEMDAGNLAHGYFTDPEQVLGMELRRPSRPGEVFTPVMLAPPRLVQRGQSVVVQAESGAARVTMRGEALEHGTEGQRIRVRNTRSDRVVEGTVIGEGRVRVTM